MLIFAKSDCWGYFQLAIVVEWGRALALHAEGLHFHPCSLQMELEKTILGNHGDLLPISVKTIMS